MEINALWYNALCIVAALSAREEDPGAEPLFALADQVARSFRRRFLLPGGGLRDVVDGPDGDELRVRPNQILAVSRSPFRCSPDRTPNASSRWWAGSC